MIIFQPQCRIIKNMTNLPTPIVINVHTGFVLKTKIVLNSIIIYDYGPWCVHPYNAK